MSEGEQSYKTKVREAFKANRVGYRVDYDVLTEAAKLFVQSEQHRKFLEAFTIFVGQVANENGINSLVTETLEVDSNRIVRKQSALMVQLEQIRTNIQHRKTLSETFQQIYEKFYSERQSNTEVKEVILDDLKKALSNLNINSMVKYFAEHEYKHDGVLEHLRQEMGDTYPRSEKDQFVLGRLARLAYKIYRECTEALKAKAIISREVSEIIKTSLNELLDV